MGDRFEPDKFGTAGLTPSPATPGWPPRVAECPVQQEVELLSDRPLSAPHLTALEVRVVRSFFAPAILNAAPPCGPGPLAPSDHAFLLAL